MKDISSQFALIFNPEWIKNINLITILVIIIIIFIIMVSI